MPAAPDGALNQGGVAVRRFILGALVAVVAALSASSTASASAPETLHHGHIGGIVRARGAASATAQPGGNLLYHGGPVLHTNTTYAIYWVPTGYSVDSTYVSTINGFFSNVAKDSGKTSNVYWSDSQYTDGSGAAAYSSTFAGSFVDRHAFPASGCRDPYTAICLTDAQIRAEITRVMGVKGWKAGPGKIFFMFTAKNVGSCFHSNCSFKYFCAYHGSYGASSNPTLYANQPYAAFVPSRCGSGQRPNGGDADSTINVASHEHNESNTDPLGTAWYDSAGYENGDKCAWTFGTVLGSTTTGKYNQVIGTGKYYLQQEWSNQSSGCVLTGL
jgi:hypothetical protein